MKDKKRWGKLVETFINFFSIVVMLFAFAFAVAREVSWPFIIIVALECPLWVILAKKFFWEDKPWVSWIVRGVILIGGYLALSICVSKLPYNRCYHSVAKQYFQENFESNFKKDGMSYVDTGDISTQVIGDYSKLTAVVSYTEDGTQKDQTMTIYFDRFDGKYYKDFDDLKTYRVGYRKQYKTSDFRNRSFFDTEQVEQKTTAIVNCLATGTEDEFVQFFSEDAQENAKKIWSDWEKAKQEQGVYQGESGRTKDWKVANDADFTQTMVISTNLAFEKKTIAVKVVLDQDLWIGSMEIS